MQTFYFKGRDTQGRIAEGKRFAASAESLAKQLTQENITPISIQIQKTTWVNFQNLFHFKRLPLTELMLFCRQMYSLIKAGIPIINSLTRLIETSKNAYTKKTLKNVLERINSGESFSSSLQKQNAAFPPLLINVVEAGERGGKLEEAFLELSNYFVLEEKTLKKLKTVLRYPTFVIIALLVAVLVINLLVIPAFANLFKRLNTDLPLATKILIYTSDFLINYKIPLFISSVASVVSVSMALKHPRGLLLWHQSQRKLPVVGLLLNKIHMIRFARIMAMTYQAGLSVPESLYLSAQAIGNEHVKNSLLKAKEAIQHGSSLNDSLRDIKLLSPIALQMLVVGVETGYLSEMLNEIADFYEREVDYDLTKLSDAIEPILLIGMGILVLILALGVFLPMWDTARLARGGY